MSSVSLFQRAAAFVIAAAVPVVLYAAIAQEDNVMQPSEKLRKVGFVLLGVTDVERSAAFYRDRLGLTVQSKSEGFVFFDAGGITLGLSKDLGATCKPTAGAVEVVFPVDDVNAMHVALKARGVDFTREPRQVTAAEWAANFVDPDGHCLSIFGPPTGKAK